MKRELRFAIDRETSQLRAAFAQGRMDLAFHHAERAHILGQRYFVSHLSTHLWMLRIGLRRGDRREVVGQIVRLAAVVPGYLIGWIPKGNSGGANVSALRPMTIPPDIAPLLADYSIQKDVLKRGVFWGAFAAIACIAIILSRL